MLENLTPEQLSKASHCSIAVAKEWLPYFQVILPKYEINTKQRLAAFFSQTGHESGGFSILQENLNYSAEGLANTWPKRYAKTLQNGSYAKDSRGRYLPSDLALKLARKPILIASNCYANRMGNGDEASQDGWKYRGRGILQITGKSNYALLTLNTGIDFVSEPDLLLKPEFAIISACEYWKENKLNQIADKGDIELLSKRINGGAIGLKERKELYQKALKALE